MQERLPIGATLVPIIIASDKTQLTRFSGDKQAYLTIGNIDKESRRRPSSRATVLLGYIPVAKLEIFKKKNRSGVGYQLFHGCMHAMLQSLKAVGRDGVTMDWADGFPNCRGHTTHSKWRCPAETLQLLADQSNGEYPVELMDQHLHAINPFFDPRFRAMAPHPNLRHFKKGISLTTQWTGAERKNMEKVFLGILAGATDPRVQFAVRGTHCDESLLQLEAAWLALHANKDVFVELGIREHFNISKLHKLKHYVDSIRSRGTADGFNTEGTERLHIDLAKLAYNASNKKAYTRQMTVWLRRQESVHKFGSYLQWAVPGYLAPISADSSDDEDEDVEDAPGQDLPEDSDDEGELEEVADSKESSKPTYIVAKKPGFPSLTAKAITTDFKAPDFLDNLTDFLHSKSIIPRLLTLPAIAEVGSGDTRDTIRAVKGQPLRMTPKGVKPEKAGQFDTVLARLRPKQADESATGGLCVACVRVIFRIPPDFGEFPEPVTYVDWFNPLQPPVAGLGMHQVSLSSRNLHQRSSIIAICDIFAAAQ
ncbi:hypothetical protein B0H13DRAFT_2236195 [Mycena leptocephala]|nr:hypothetical protein B0H13DRAFT_2236195 [Mycena leptocephala]